MNYGENGLAIYSDGNKKLYILVINNINEQTGMVYFKNSPAYRIFFDGKLKATNISKSPAVGFRINKLPGFVNRQRKETGQLEFPGMEKKFKKPVGGYPALFNATKNVTTITELGKLKEFDDWIVANKSKYDLSPPRQLTEDDEHNKFPREQFVEIEKEFLDFAKDEKIIDEIIGIGSYYKTENERVGDLDYVLKLNVPFNDFESLFPFSDRVETIKEKHKNYEGETFLNIFLIDNQDRMLNSVDLWFIKNQGESLADNLADRSYLNKYRSDWEKGKRLNETFVKNIIRKIIKEDYYDEESDVEIPSTYINDIVYHGTALNPNEDSLFDEFKIGHSDWDAIWVSEQEEISEEFAEEKKHEDDIEILYRIKLDADNLADISPETHEETKSYYGYEDLREFIPTLSQMGFEGWMTTGSIGSNLYNDIAIFDEDLIVIDGVKLKINDEWTDYLSLDKAYKIFENMKLNERLLREVVKDVFKARMTPKHIKYWALFANFYDLFKDVHTLDNLDKVYNLGVKKLPDREVVKNAFNYFYNFRKEELLKRHEKRED